MLKGKLPSEIVNERHQYVNALKQFVDEQKQKLQEVLLQLGLTEESLAKIEPKQSCPFDPNHLVPEKSFKKHIAKCRLVAAGYQRDELPSQLQNTDFCYEGKNSMKIELDESLINKIIWDDCVQNGEVYTGHRPMPVSHIDESINLTQNDRLAIYRYVVSKSHEAGKVIPVDKSDELLTTDWGSLVKKGLLDAQNNEKYSSKLEQLAALRDMKRRRQSYRAKNVHITKKSYTEIIREVISNQMEVLTPVKSKKSTEDSDHEEQKSRNSKRDRKRRERERDDDRESHSHSRRKRSRSRNREKRRRYEEQADGGQDRDESSKSRKSKSSDLPEWSRSIDLERVKEEPMSNESVNFRNSKESVLALPSPGFDRTDGNSSTPGDFPNEKKKARSQSRSSSQSSIEGRHQHHHHNKSKHKKKSKHSKKHSKKHKH